MVNAIFIVWLRAISISEQRHIVVTGCQDASACVNGKKGAERIIGDLDRDADSPQIALNLPCDCRTQWIIGGSHQANHEWLPVAYPNVMIVGNPASLCQQSPGSGKIIDTGWNCRVIDE